jgi:hypothetical protein
MPNISIQRGGCRLFPKLRRVKLREAAELEEPLATLESRFTA